MLYLSVFASDCVQLYLVPCSVTQSLSYLHPPSSFFNPFSIPGAGGLNLQFVFVSACYSMQVGEAFVKAGVPHVVCVKVDTKVKMLFIGLISLRFLVFVHVSAGDSRNSTCIFSVNDLVHAFIYHKTSYSLL